MPTEIRLATIDDAAEIQAIYEPIVLETAISFELVPPTVEEFQERITRTLEKTPWLMCEIDGAVAGYTYAGQHRAGEVQRWVAGTSARFRGTDLQGNGRSRAGDRAR